MDENGEMVEIRARSDSFPIALMALPVKPQCMWTLEPEHAQNIRGGQVRATCLPSPLLNSELRCSQPAVVSKFL